MHRCFYNKELPGFSIGETIDFSASGFTLRQYDHSS